MNNFFFRNRASEMHVCLSIPTHSYKHKRYALDNKGMCFAKVVVNCLTMDATKAWYRLTFVRSCDQQ